MSVIVIIGISLLASLLVPALVLLLAEFNLFPPVTKRQRARAQSSNSEEA